jgi:SAM-dependent methyltransferase
MDTIAIRQDRLDELLGRAVNDLAAGYAGVLVSIGDRLGLYRAMAGQGPMTAREVAERSGCAARYVREWLSAQAAGGYVDYDGSDDTFHLTPEQALVFADRDSPVFLPPAWQVPASMWFDEEKSIAAFRSGDGVAWGDHDQRMICGVAGFYRNAYRASLVSDWLPALDGVADRLRAGARVADIGCGHGHSTVLMAEAFPKSRFWGFDTHAGSIAAARANAVEAGVADRVTFDSSDASACASGSFDLVCYFDCLHDMGDPVAAATRAASLLAENGTVMLVEPYANDALADNLNPVGRLYYAASTTLCCAHAISEGGPMALGAQAGEARLAAVFREAGFGHFRRAHETPFNLILEARR